MWRVDHDTPKVGRPAAQQLVAQSRNASCTGPLGSFLLRLIFSMPVSVLSRVGKLATFGAAVGIKSKTSNIRRHDLDSWVVLFFLCDEEILLVMLA